jgi:putative hydrolase of the HAD superfamily
MNAANIDWTNIRLVAFDVDGTLYDHKPMRFRMLRELAAEAARSRSLTALRVVQVYRRLRETLGDAEVGDFEAVVVARTAERTRVAAETVRTIVTEWIEVRPLAHIRACRYPHVAELFAALARQGKTIGIVSDYPAVEKVRAMGLRADHIVAAGDASVGMLKPHPRGLQVLMKAAGVDPSQAVLVGDRIDRDGEAARRAGVAPLIRSKRPLPGWLTFSSFSDPLFAPVLGR